MSTDAERLPARDKSILAMLIFFLAVAFTLEAWWLLHASRLVELSQSSALARLFGVYGVCDSTYYDKVSSLSLTLEGINVCFTPLLDVWLIYAIVKRRHYRHALQLGLASYLTYSLVLYYMQAHLSGYADMKERSFYTFALFYGVNLPWFGFHLYMVWDSVRAINRRFLVGERSAQLARGVAGQEVRRGEAGLGGVVVDDEAARA